MTSAGTGCAIHERRPTVCHSYRCLWLQGGLEDEDRPDRLGAIVDLVSTGDSARLSIREARPGAFDASPRLQAIAERFRSTVPVRIADADDPMNPDKPCRVLLPGGEEQHVAGERVRILRPDRTVENRRLPWLERTVLKASLFFARRKWQRLARRPMGVPGERRPDESR